MQLRIIGVALLAGLLSTTGCTPKPEGGPTASASALAYPSLGVPQWGAEPCPGTPQQPPSRSQRLIRGFLDIRNFPSPGANGGNLNIWKLGIDLECVLGAADGWASPSLMFDLRGGPDNDLFHVVLLTKQHLHDKNLGGCQNLQDDSCAQIRAGQPENRCSIVVKFEPDWEAVDRAGIIYHELGHCFFGPQHSNDPRDLMFGQLPGERAKTARPNIHQKAWAQQRAEQAEPIFMAP